MSYYRGRSNRPYPKSNTNRNRFQQRQSHNKHNKYNTRNVHNPRQSANDVDSVYFVYPKGRPCWLWVRLDENGEPSVRFYWEFPCAYSAVSMDTEGDYQTVYARVHPYLTIGHGTLLKGQVRHEKSVPVVTVREVIWWKGEYVMSTHSLVNLFVSLKQMIGKLDKTILTKVCSGNNGYNGINGRNKTSSRVRCVQICLPLAISAQYMKANTSAQSKQAMLEYLDGLKYDVYQVVKYSMNATSKQGQPYHWSDFYKAIQPPQPKTMRFEMTKMPEQDSYKLRSMEHDIETVFVVSTIKQSRMLNRWMNTTYGINCLDDIEESDNESDDGDDDVLKSIHVECIRDGKKWIPVRCLTELE